MIICCVVGIWFQLTTLENDETSADKTSFSELRINDVFHEFLCTNRAVYVRLITYFELTTFD